MNDKPMALVTGGSRGIGLGIGRHLSKVGFDVAINGRRPEAEVVDALEAIERQGGSAMYVQADLAAPGSIERIIHILREHTGRLDVLVNNAGVAPEKRADLLEATPDSFDRLIDINLKGPYFLTQAAAKWMIEQAKANEAFDGKIINVGSISATVVSVNRGDYCLSKAGVAMATQLWAARLAEFGIDVFEVRPGIIETDMTATVKDKYDHLLKETDLVVEKRWGTADDVGRACAMLARGDLSYATGQVLTLDGGLTMRRL